MLQYFYMSEPLYLLAITFTKLSLLLFFRRIFPNERMNRLIYAVMGFIVLTNSILILALTFQCVSSFQPLHKPQLIIISCHFMVTGQTGNIKSPL